MVLLPSPVCLGYSSSTENTYMILVTETGQYEEEVAYWVHKVGFSLPGCDEQDSNGVCSCAFPPF